MIDTSNDVTFPVIYENQHILSDARSIEEKSDTSTLGNSQVCPK